MNGREIKAKIRELLLSAVPLEYTKKTLPNGLRGGARWTGDDDADRRALLYEIEGLYDPQSTGFMVDILPYFFDRLRRADSRVKTDEQLTVLDVGGRTGVGANLLGQIFYGTWSQRKIAVDVVDINPVYGEFIAAARPFVRKFICSDIAELPEQSYDYVICSHVIEHVEDPMAFSKELRRISKRGVIVYCPFEEFDPIPGHNTITRELIQELGAEDIVTTSKSWFWKRDDRPNQETVMFWLPA